MAKRMPNSGFTLIELLVVMAIVGVLMALLFPALQQAKKVADQTDCKNTQKNLSQASLMYAGNWQGFFPHGPSSDGKARTPLDQAGSSKALGLLYTQDMVRDKRAYQCRSDGADKTLITS